MKYVIWFMLICFPLLLAGQSNSSVEGLQQRYADSTYFEDQIYAGMVYNVLLGKPSGVSQNNFSNGFTVGFIKDIPLNNKRNKALGIGVGYGNNSFYYNIRAYKANNDIQYEIIDSDVSYKRSKLETHAIEIPLEYRWRTSDVTTTKFWRIYTGVKMSYAFSRISKYISSTEKIVFTNTDINPWQLSGYLSAGYNTWNVYGSFTFTNIFTEDIKLNDSDEPINMGFFNVGLIFYIL
ncbi:Outer membrane protein beta-barrel domain-containing protein [Pustulibacterium marinum]|uniref:Outer membrane protein beta-barrel domain-containing protein n=1 Tax=Pustulibacterium marinum TaxID=1224947 RepID=A0A1I7HBL8_9FLAO|nr:porin family protein [Pustulibacterium marinum]SFU58002.1 Outer membrane protein beta-barrel domain-containing protein [Pustulibacterium marinum]